MKRILFVIALGGLLFAPAFADSPPWRPSVQGGLSQWPVQVGYSDDGTPLYLIRSTKGDVTSLGYFDPATKRGLLLDATGVQQTNNFEVWAGGGRWVNADADSLPAGGFDAGKGKDGKPALMVRVTGDGWLIPAIYSAKDRGAITYINNKRVVFDTFEVLVTDWGKPGDPAIRSQAFIGGRDSDGSDLVPLQASKGKSLQLGKWSAKNRKGYIPWGGKELEMPADESNIFIGMGIWQAADPNTLPVGAIPAGVGDDGNLLYIIRAKQKGADSLGKFSAVQKAAYVPYGGQEVPVKNFEVLCYDLSTDRVDSLAREAPVARAAASATPAPNPPAAKLVSGNRIPIPPLVDTGSLWLPATKGTPPPGSIAVGKTPDGVVLFLARANKAGVASPGYLDPRNKQATIYADKRTEAADAFEVWTGGGQWLAAKAYAMPPDALSAGLDAGGQPVPIIRVNSGDWVLPGWFSQADNAAVAWVEGKRQLFGNFDVLVPEWVSLPDLAYDARPLVAGKDADGAAIGIIRHEANGGWIPGKWRIDDNQGYIPVDGREKAIDDPTVQVFTGNGVWIKPIRASAPDGAIPAGFDPSGNILYVARGKVDKADVVGYYNPATNEALVPYGGKALKVTAFEILCYPPPAAAATAGKSPVPLTPSSAMTISNRKPATATSWGETTVRWGEGAKAKAIPAANAKPSRIATAFGISVIAGELKESDRAKDGNRIKLYSYEGTAQEELSLSVSSQSACPGLFLISPTGLWMETFPPATDQTDPPGAMGGENHLNAVLPEKGTYTVLLLNGLPGGAGAYNLQLTGRGQQFDGSIGEKTAFSAIEITPEISGYFSIDLFADNFNPAILAFDKSSFAAIQPMAWHDEARSSNRLVFIKAKQTVTIQFRRADTDKSPGTLTYKAVVTWSGPEGGS